MDNELILTEENKAAIRALVRRIAPDFENEAVDRHRQAVRDQVADIFNSPRHPNHPHVVRRAFPFSVTVQLGPLVTSSTGSTPYIYTGGTGFGLFGPLLPDQGLQIKGR